MIGDLQSWDQVATLYAVRGGAWGGRTVGETAGWGDMEFSIRKIEKPSNPAKDIAVDVEWMPGINAGRTYLKQVPDRDQCAEEIESLMTQRNSRSQ